MKLITSVKEREEFKGPRSKRKLQADRGSIGRNRSIRCATRANRSESVKSGCDRKQGVVLYWFEGDFFRGRTRPFMCALKWNRTGFAKNWNLRWKNMRSIVSRPTFKLTKKNMEKSKHKVGEWRLIIYRINLIFLYFYFSFYHGFSIVSEMVVYLFSEINEIL